MASHEYIMSLIHAVNAMENKELQLNGSIFLGLSEFTSWELAPEAITIAAAYKSNRQNLSSI